MSTFLTVVGFVSLGLALIFSGVLGSGDRIRANYSHEEKEDRTRRFKTSGILLLIAIISLGLNYILFGNQ